MAPSATTPQAASWQRLCRATGIAGLTAVVLVFVVLVGSRSEPAFDAPAAEFLTHYQASNTVASPLRSFGLVLALMSFVWFGVALSLLLARAEKEPPWRSSIAMVSAVLFAVLVLSGSEVAAVLTADDLDPQIARYAFEESQASFANARVAMGSFAVCSGWVIASTRCLPRWSGWLAIVSGGGLVLARIDWTNMIWLVPYMLVWVWVLEVALVLLRRGFAGAAEER
jgi:hypothetical protein